ncbi:MAG TPA: hypothetical protein VM580_16285 [Labilithrix sp.]|nr:hypothetical protein [Labilithrix sp.]
MIKRVLFVAAASSVLVACSLILDADRNQCKTIADCAARGTDWSTASCVANVCVFGTSDSGPEADASDPSDPLRCADEERLARDPNRRVKLTQFYHDVVAEVPLSDATIRLCGRLDPECNAPRLTVSPDPSTGEISLDVEFGFDGFVEVQGPLLFPTLFQTEPPSYADKTEYRSGITTDILDFLARRAYPAGPDPELGHIHWNVEDCDAVRQEGINVFASSSAGEKTRQIYLYSWNPRTDVDQTDTDGRGFLLNVPPGNTTLTAVYRGTGKTLGKATVAVRKGFITSVLITPATR